MGVDLINHIYFLKSSKYIMMSSDDSSRIIKTTSTVSLSSLNLIVSNNSFLFSITNELIINSPNPKSISRPSYVT